MAISAVLAVGEIGDELVAKIAERARTLRTGAATPGCDMGPLVTAQARDRVSGETDAGEQAQAALRMALPGLCRLAIGGTAVGTGLNAHRSSPRAYASSCARRPV